jgi:hypothetical protein
MTRLAGVLLLLLCLVAPAPGQVSGHVEGIGFSGVFRPATWTPMRIRLQLNSGPAAPYDVKVWQRDSDGDVAAYSTRVTLTPGAEQSFWTYFIPEPINQGLPPAQAELAERLRVTIHSTDGKEVAQIPLKNVSAITADSPYAVFEPTRGSRLVLFVTESRNTSLGEYDPNNVVGLMEDLMPVRLDTTSLPDSSVGYQGVDAVVWLDADPAKLTAGGSNQMEALRGFVRGGGHLVINTPGQYQQLNAMEDLMPVDIQGIEVRNSSTIAWQNLYPLLTVARFDRFAEFVDGKRRLNPWTQLKGPFQFARATVRTGGLVEQTIDWENDDDVEDAATLADNSPWLVRRGFGNGCVSWVAQDLTDPQLLSARYGWASVWETLLGHPTEPDPEPTVKEKAAWRAVGMREFGAGVLPMMNLTSASAKLVAVTMVFFFGYWLVAGPGVFAWLKMRKKSQFNWVGFAMVAVAATLLTLGLVRILIRGKPELRHLTTVRINQADNLPAHVVSRLGLYVKADGYRELSIAGIDPKAHNSLTAFPLNERLASDLLLVKAPKSYDAGPRTPAGSEPVATLSLPFRTSMKRVRADWTGPLPMTLDGTIRVDNRLFLSGKVRNLTGVNLADVHFVFRREQSRGNFVDMVLHVPRWNAGDELDLARINAPDRSETGDNITLNDQQGVNDKEPRRGGLLTDWMPIWYRGHRVSAISSTEVQNMTASYSDSFYILSLFNRLRPMSNPPGDVNRAELRRSGVRDMDISNALMAGRLVVIADSSDTPMPIPFSIDGDPAGGSGRTLYQFVLPLVR